MCPRRRWLKQPERTRKSLLFSYIPWINETLGRSACHCGLNYPRRTQVAPRKRGGMQSALVTLL
jgi:hypothetical protein